MIQDAYVLSIVREEILDARTSLRKSIAERNRAKTALDCWENDIKIWMQRIASLQTECGDPIEIDPANPELVLTNTPPKVP